MNIDNSAPHYSTLHERTLYDASAYWASFSLLICITLLSVTTKAEEQLCSNLADNCVCSEPLNTTTYNGTAPFWNPADSVIKECVNEAGTPISRWKPVIAGSSPRVLAALPAGSSITHYLRGPEAHSGIFYVGHKLLGSTFQKRAAMRVYMYHSGLVNGDLNDFRFAYQTGVDDQGQPYTCENHKFIDPYIGTLGGYPDLKPHTYGWGPAGTNPMTYNNGASMSDSTDLKSAIPFGPKDWIGQWVRVEVVISNRSGGPSPNGFRFQLYIKNITAGTPEVLAMDSMTSNNKLWPAAGFDDLTPTKIVNDFLVNNYRQGKCPGYRALSHYIVAGWDTNAGQRIGSSSEIEGSAGTIDSNIIKPLSPTTLQVQ